MVKRMYHYLFFKGALISAVSAWAALVAMIKLPFDPTGWPILWPICKTLFLVVLAEVARRLFVVYVLDRYIPDRSARRSLWRTRRRPRKLNPERPLGLDDEK